jgi:hypothetical protein
VHAHRRSRTRLLRWRTVVLGFAVVLVAVGIPLVNVYNAEAATTISRSTVMTRSQSWIDARVPYSQTSYYTNQYGTYRQDCSGYVSMSWALATSLTTASLPDVMTQISRSSLKAGDALWRRDASVGHIALFVRWADAAHTQPVVREEYDYGHVAEERTWSASWANTFTPMRYDNIDDTPTTPAADPVNFPVAVTGDGSGRYDVFAASGGRHLVHRYYLPDSGWGPGGGWEVLGGSLKSGPAAAMLPGNIFHVFVRGLDDKLWHRSYTPSSSWSEWTSIGGTITSAPTVAVNGTRMDVFARGSDNALWHSWYISGQGFSDWKSRGGRLTSNPSVVKLPNGGFDVFARGSDNAIWHTTYTGSSSDWQWRSLGGNAKFGPAAVGNGDGSAIDVFTGGADGALYQLHHPPGGGWTWNRIGGTITTTPGAVRVGNRIDAYVRGTTGALYQYWNTNGGVGTWQSKNLGLTVGT